MSLSLSEFDYVLPPELIAQQPLTSRSASRLLVLEGNDCIDSHFVDLPLWLRAGDLLVMNDSRVLHARLLGRKGSGGQVEILIERLLDGCEVLAQIRASKPAKPGSHLQLEGALDVEVLGREGEFFRLRFPGDAAGLIERHGRLPLPPYIERAVEAPDEERYQTVYARETGSVAAPTAGLHFDEEMFARLGELGVDIAYVTLHVGAGTFQPVRVSNLSEHRMHTERYELSSSTCEAIAATRERGGRVVAVGTTSLRALESAAVEGVPKVGAGETALFVTPGFKFRVADMLITNFHLPKSTLLMLVSAFAGVEETRTAYRHAIAEKYRFFSYGDAMLLSRKPND
ncbi:MAG: tRNA preQ1(34) S-adenosylmethionine ribosyltransferase-isomerase QueA [Sulfuritalea sp.]|nr:tRNA preQ1(34) S-adenosylmethionine ribosyltransferase-isomerase QueA [Sulfuritalea sp.]